MSFGSRHKKLTWGRFHKAKMLAFYYWRENTNKIVLALKTPHCLATSIRQHVANLSIFVAHFGVIVAHFGVFKEYFRITGKRTGNDCYISCTRKETTFL